MTNNTKGLDEILNAVTNFTYDAMAHPGDPLVGTLPTMDKATAKKELLAIIRTEKLKLLVEVRERVIGEKKDQEYRLIDTEYASTRKEKVYLSDGISRNKLRNEQITELTKLEAEL